MAGVIWPDVNSWSGSPIDFGGGSRGTIFTPSSSFDVGGIRYQTSSVVGTVTGRLWVHGGAVVASATFTATVDSNGWATATFGTPFTVSSGTTYAAIISSTSTGQSMFVIGTGWPYSTPPLLSGTPTWEWDTADTTNEPANTTSKAYGVDIVDTSVPPAPPYHSPRITVRNRAIVRASVI